MRAALVLALLLLASCDRSTPQAAGSPSSTPQPEPQATTSAPAAPAPTAAQGVSPAPSTASSAEREGAVLALIAGEMPFEALPEHATEPGAQLNPNLRDQLSPRVRPVRVRVGKAEVQGDLPPEVIQRIVRQRFGAFRFCHEQEKNPELAGTLTLAFKILASGQISAVTVAKNGTGSARLGLCLQTQFRKMTFPKPTDAKPVSVKYSMTFGDG